MNAMGNFQHFSAQLLWDNMEPYNAFNHII